MLETKQLSPELMLLNRDIVHFPQVKPITADMNKTFKGVSRLVMLDRYSFKDTKHRTLKVGDLVILTYKEDPKWPSRGYGYLQSVDEITNEAVVRLDEQFEGGREITIAVNKLDKPLELFYEQICDRVARGLAEAELQYTDSMEKFLEVKDSFYEILVTEAMVPAGRVLMGAGSGTDVTYFNCYVMPFIHDSRDGLAEHRKKVMEIMSRGGGVGTNGSTLRPRNAYCFGVNGRSSGSVTWLNDLANLTNLVEQGGSRRGAQMIMLNDWHPDIIEFVISKMQNPKVLQFILETTESKLIREEVERKLKFMPLTPNERVRIDAYVKAYEAMSRLDDVVQFENEDVQAYNEAKQLLTDGGRFSVHEPEFLTGANISVCITKEFMEAVENNAHYDLRFPDTESHDEEMRKIYDADWQECGDVREWEKRGYPVRTYHTIKAKDLWDLINTAATYSAEPGIFFLDNANEMTNAAAYGHKVVATNPCGEQPLAPWSVCNLAAVNLAVMATEDGRVDYEKLMRTVMVGVRMQDNVIDSTPYFLEENTKQALGERRVGMGVMGLHDLLLNCGVAYGSEEGNVIVDKVFETMATTAYRASIDLAKEKGSFPFLETLPNGDQNTNGREKFVESGYMKKMPEDIRQGILEYGIRNSHLLTVAPTGSTGTMMNVSTGLEPYFSFTYYRSGRLGKFIPVVADIAEKWLTKNGYEITEDNALELVGLLPDYFVGTMDLLPEQHVDTQCIIQNWIDSSLSKTVNAPRGYSVRQVAGIYEMLHKGGAKGGTVYVDGSRDAQVLSLTADDNDVSNNELVIEPDQALETITIVNTLVSPDEPKANIGGDTGQTCFICEQGTMVESGGCVTCNNCGMQSKCGL
jgi:ribonucleoside-diphosphate reductase alpha chain